MRQGILRSVSPEDPPGRSPRKIPRKIRTFYTTPSWPVDIKYEIIMESKGEMVLDGVLNEWDMDHETNAFESRGTWVFGMNPAEAAEPFRDFMETYEGVPQ